MNEENCLFLGGPLNGTYRKLIPQRYQYYRHGRGGPFDVVNSTLPKVDVYICVEFHSPNAPTIFRHVYMHKSIPVDNWNTVMYHHLLDLWINRDLKPRNPPPGTSGISPSKDGRV